MLEFFFATWKPFLFVIDKFLKIFDNVCSVNDDFPYVFT